MSRLAIKLVKECLDRQDTYLDLRYCGLTDFDFIKGGRLYNDLSECTQLETLILSNNQKKRDSSVWSQKIEGIQDSRYYGQENYLHYLPDVIASLLNLKVLVCSGLSSELKPIDHSFFLSLKKLEVLDLSGNRIKEVPVIKNSGKIKRLDLSDNDIKEIIDVGNMVSLEYLDIGRNRIKEITGIQNLTSLRCFLANHNIIREITSLEPLVNLEVVDISRNEIRGLKGLENLKSLKLLDASSNMIDEIPGFEGLISLSELYMEYNLLQHTKGLSNLTGLKILDLANNRIRQITGVSALKNLETLNLIDNQLSSIESLIPLLAVKFKIVHNGRNWNLASNEINVFNNPLTYPPIEVIEQGSKAILHYHSELEKQGVEYLYEAKMLIVGQPRAGKTSLRDKLFNINEPLPTEDKTTRGIDIKRLDFEIIDRDGKPRKFYYNLWDFGGQHIYQTTHQFFLTHRSLYVLVIDTGKDSIGNDDTTINYWLQAVELLGDNSPMLLVKNEKNERHVHIDLPKKRERFSFLKNDYSVDLNALIARSPQFSSKRLNEFNHLKEDIQTELKRLPLVGFPMPKNWAEIRKQLQTLSEQKYYISQQEYIAVCEQHDVSDFEKQMELSRIFHDLGVFLHFQDYATLDDFIILQNTWATDAVFAVFDNDKVKANRGRFSSADLAGIWKDKKYHPSVHRKLLQLMMQFELCYLVDKSSPNVYIIPEMLEDSREDITPWNPQNDLPLQYRYDFMPRGILTRVIVRLHKNIDLHNGRQIVWKTGVRIDGNTIDCPNTVAEITEAWDNKRLDIKVQGPFCKELMSKISYQIDELNNEFFRQVNKDTQKSKWYKMIPCNCVTCKDSAVKHFYDYSKLLERKSFGKTTIECDNPPYGEVNITALLDGVFVKDESRTITSNEMPIVNRAITLFLASSSELKSEREQFELFISRENKQLHKKGIFLKLEVWEDFLDKMSQTRLQDEYNEAVKNCDIFVMLYFTKVGKYTAEEFETAFRTFKETNKPRIYTYFKKADIKSTDQNREGTTSLWAFQDKLKELGHYQTEFENDAQLHLHFKKQLEKLYDL